MLHDRDDFTLLARAGRTPHEIRAGPTGRLRPAREPAPPRPRPGRVERALARLPALLSERARRRGCLDRREYLELEFAVGFGADEEQPG
ncbi:MAG: hypothetical protein ACYCXW_21905 [Solirubrobacteraceae bacterium]